MRRDARSGVLLATLLCGGAWGGGAYAADAVPDLGFLEYLGGLVEQDGEWVGPDDMGVADQVAATEVSDEPAGGETPQAKAEETEEEP